MSNTIPIIVQARMSSKRLFGKVLLPLAGKPVLVRLLERLQLSRRNFKIIVATSENSEDDEIEDLCRNMNVRCYRGALKSVADRFRAILEAHPEWTHFVRICGDSPLLDPELIALAHEVLVRSNAHIVTNVFPRNFPRGQSIELFESKVFLDELSKFSSDEQEHLGMYFYNKAHLFRVENFAPDGDYSHLSYVVDTADDYLRLAKMFRFLESIDGASLGWKEIASLRM